MFNSTIMAEKLTREVYDDGTVVWSILNDLGIPIIGANDTATATKVLDYWDGTSMDASKVDGKIYLELSYEETPGNPASDFVRVNLPNFGETFLEVDTMTSLRNLSSTDILLLKMGYYQGVRLNGYQSKGDIPTLEYFLSDTTETDDGGSVIAIGDIKVEGSPDSVEGFGAVGDGVNLDFEPIQNAINYAKKSKGTVRFESENYYIGNNELIAYLSVRLFLTKKTTFTFNISNDAGFGITILADINSNLNSGDPLSTSDWITGRELNIINISVKHGTAVGIKAVDQNIQISNFVFNNTKIWNWNIGVQLLPHNLYLVKFKNLHVNRCSVGLEANNANKGSEKLENSGENIRFEFCVFGSNEIAIDIPTTLNGFWFDGCSFDFNQCVINQTKRAICVFQGCWIEGTNYNRGGDLSIFGLVHGNSLTAQQTNRSIISFINTRFVSSWDSLTNYVSDKLIEDTDAYIYFENITASQSTPGPEYQNNPENLFYIGDNIVYDYKNADIFLRHEGVKLLGKRDFAMETKISYKARRTLQLAGSNNIPIGSLRVKFSSGCDYFDTTDTVEDNIIFHKSASSTNASITIEPNSEPIPVSWFKNLRFAVLPQIAYQSEDETMTARSYVNLQFMDSAGRTINTYESNLKYLGLDDVSNKILSDLNTGEYVIPYEPSNKLKVTSIPDNASKVRFSVRVSISGGSEATVKIRQLGLIFLDERRTLDYIPMLYAGESYPATADAIMGSTMFNTGLRRNLTYNGLSWIEYDGVRFDTLRSGETAQRPTVGTNYIYAGFQFIDTDLNRPIWWNGSNWIDSNGSVV